MSSWSSCVNFGCLVLVYYTVLNLYGDEYFMFTVVYKWLPGVDLSFVWCYYVVRTPYSFHTGGLITTLHMFQKLVCLRLLVSPWAREQSHIYGIGCQRYRLWEIISFFSKEIPLAQNSEWLKSSWICMLV